MLLQDLTTRIRTYGNRQVLCRAANTTTTALIAAAKDAVVPAGGHAVVAFDFAVGAAAPGEWRGALVALDTDCSPIGFGPTPSSRDHVDIWYQFK
jgi:hypothetical protein